MLLVLKIIALAYIWLVLPVLVGRLWGLFQKDEHNAPVLSGLLGTLTIWAIFFIIAKQAINAKWKLSDLSRMWAIIVILLSVVAVVCLIHWKDLRLKHSVWNVKKLMISLEMLILLVAVAIFSVNDREEHMAEEVLTMYTTDSLYEYSPMNGKEKDELLTLEVEALEQQAEAPIGAYYATYVVLTHVFPTKFVRILLPIFLMPFYFSIYIAWGNYLFPASARKRYFFQIIVWLLYGTTLIEEHSVEFGIFANCWNGETLFFLGVLPIAVLLLLGEKKNARKLEDFKQPYLIAEYMVCAAAGQLLCEKGFFYVTFVWGIALIATCIKRWKDGSSITAFER